MSASPNPPADAHAILIGPDSRHAPSPLTIHNWAPLDQPWATATLTVCLAAAVSAFAILDRDKVSLGAAVVSAVGVLSAMILPAQFQFLPTGITRAHFGRVRKMSWIDVRDVQMESGKCLLHIRNRRRPEVLEVWSIHFRDKEAQLAEWLRYYLGPRLAAEEHTQEFTFPDLANKGNADATPETSA